MEWRTWGVPIEDIAAVSRQEGGPFGESGERHGLITFGPPPLPPEAPALSIAPDSGADSDTGALVFVPREFTRGVVGNGLRIVAWSQSGIVEVEWRGGSHVDEGSCTLRLMSAAGKHPAAVARELRKLDDIADKGDFGLSIMEGPQIMSGASLQPPAAAKIVRTVAECLTTLQEHTAEDFSMPEVSDITIHQLDALLELVAIYEGEAVHGNWERLVLQVDDLDALRGQNLFPGSGALVMTEQPEFYLGTTKYLVTRMLAHQYMTPVLAPGVDLEMLSSGEELELVAGDDSRLVVAAVVEDA